MSLKVFHILFITLSTLMSVGLGAWGVRAFQAGDGGGFLCLGVLGFAGAAVLVVYGVKVFKKLRPL